MGLGLRGGRAGRGCSVPDVLRHYRAVIFEDLQAAVRRAGPSSRQRHSHQKNLTGAGPLPQRGLVGASCSAQKVGRRTSPAVSYPGLVLHPAPSALPSLHRNATSCCPSQRWGAACRRPWQAGAVGRWRRRPGPWLRARRLCCASTARRCARCARPPPRAAAGSIPGAGRAGEDGGAGGERAAEPLPSTPQSPRPTTRPARRPGHPRQLLLRALHAVATCWAKLFALHAPAAEG